MEKVLHILKTEPDNTEKILIGIMSQGQESAVFKLYEKEADYENLIDLIFQYDKAISWW